MSASIDQLLSSCGLPRQEARILLEYASGKRREWLMAHGAESPDAQVSEHFTRLAMRRQAGEPIAYLVGMREFRGLPLTVNPSVLIPRPETELLVELAAALCPQSARALDLGTGSGAIALALADARPDLRVVATDASEHALETARANAQRHPHAGARIDFRQGDWWHAVRADERFACVIANPPYLAEDDPHLREGDLRSEPRSALVSGASGLEALDMIAGGALEHLEPGGWLMLEHGREQGEAARRLLSGHRLQAVRTERDLAGHDRVTLGRAPSPR